MGNNSRTSGLYEDDDFFSSLSPNGVTPQFAPGGGRGGGGNGGGGGKNSNNPPVAGDDDATVLEDSSVIIDVLANDTDPDGNTLSIEAVSAASFGTVLINTDGTLTYIPDADFFGTDSFTYTVTDNLKGGTDTATVTVTVTPVDGDAPVAVDDTASTDTDAAVTIDVISNDVDPDGGVITVTSADGATNGTIVINGDGSVTYTPDAGFEGTDSFDYTITDSDGLTDTATVNIDVLAAAVAPPDYVQAITFEGFSELARWNFADAKGTAVTVTYAFPSEIPSYYHKGSEEAHGFDAFTQIQMDATREMMDYIENISNITFVETSIADASITLANTNMRPTYGGWAYILDGTDGIGTHPGDVWISNNFTDATKGSFDYMVILHELGHAVGLAHPHDGEFTLAEDDLRANTTMSYNGVTPEPETYMLYDIAAIQYLYGADNTYNDGDTTYDLAFYDGTRQAIWDGGGVDTLDGSALSSDLILTLVDGTLSSVGLTENFGIAYDAVIENATGGSGNDTLIGNDADNVLIGGSGTDALYGGAGDDVLYFDGADVLDGGSGFDTLVALYDAVIDAGSSLLSGIEGFDLTDSLSDVVDVVLSDILALSDNDDLYIVGDDGVDTVNVSGGASAGIVNVDGVDYALYTDGTADLFVESTLLVNEVIV